MRRPLSLLAQRSPLRPRQQYRHLLLRPRVGVVVPPVVNQNSMTTRGKRGLKFPALFEVSALSPLPRSYRAALADPNWRTAMAQEYAALIENKT